VGLSGRLGFPQSSTLKFLGLSLSLDDGSVYDDLRKQPAQSLSQSVYCILYGYADAKPIHETAKFISFRQLSGGHEYYSVFARRAIQPIEKTFGAKPRMLLEAAKLLGGVAFCHEDYAVRICSLPLVPIIVVLRAENQEFQASANIFFDSSVSNYLSTEQIAMLSELTSARLRHAYESLKGSHAP